MSESEAEAAILKWCRNEKRGGDAVQPVMRSREGVCHVIDVGRMEPLSSSDGSGRRCLIMATGADWASLVSQLPPSVLS